MSEATTISLDAMSGDRGAEIVVDAAASALQAHPGLKILLVGDEPQLRALVRERDGLAGRVEQSDIAEAARLRLALPQGLHEFAESTGLARSLTIELLLARNYGEAGALEYYAQAYGLPPVLSSHNSYHSWSRGRTDAELYLAVGFGADELGRLFGQVEQVGATRCEFCMEYENGLPIWLVSEPRVPLSSVWEQLKAYG